MTSKAWTWVAVLLMIAALAVPSLFAMDKNSGTPEGIPPRIVADYLRAVIMAHRHFYTIHIVNRLQKEGIVDASENWQATHSLPLPVQLLKETSEIAELTGPDVRYYLISQWPINKANAPANEFERMALKEVQMNPNRPYSSTTGGGERRLFETVYADVAVTTACVQCHNSHPNSPKSDFKVGDVMGGLVISFPLSNQ
ncbi:MAG: DUF3365 domain-containing protein [Nitrospirales bacterium]|nr:DUF3365 domain-containing protein [Nitrospirales bacterium]MBA3965843.1 DUF3365 domain-containing protein [Nitrospirales bacterium]